jgi:hypothetical protein
MTKESKTPSRLTTAARVVGALAALADAIAHLIRAVGGL